MKHNEKLADALTHIRPAFVAEAAIPKKKRSRVMLRLVAAVAAIALVVGISQLPRPILADSVSSAAGSHIAPRPDRDDYENYDDFRAALDAWNAQDNARKHMLHAAMLQLQPFLIQGNRTFLQSSSTENLIWSPANACIGLALTTELSGGATRQQVLQLLGSQDVSLLRQQISAIWESVYKDNGNEICTLANSLWLEEGLDFEKSHMDDLAHHYHTSVYRGDLGSSAINSAIGAWLNNNTGGLLKEATEGINLSQDTVLALYSTLYFQSKWSDQFNAANNTIAPFHAPDGDRDATFMNKKLYQTYYYWGERFSAVQLHLKNGSSMWFILPDEGMTTDDVLEDGQYMNMLLSGNYENNKYMKVNLSVPKFDVTSSMNLADGLKEMGVTDLFDPGKCDLSSFAGNLPVVFTAANQAVRVQVDEEGVKAAAYIELPGAGSAMPPEEIIDFIVDRPFLFVISKSSVPLFAGVINQP